MADFDAQERRDFARRGIAMPDGSFPIPNVESLRDAVRAVGRARPDTERRRNSVRRHIIKRARALGETDEIPENWNSDGSLKDN